MATDAGSMCLQIVSERKKFEKKRRKMFGECDYLLYLQQLIN